MLESTKELTNATDGTDHPLLEKTMPGPGSNVPAFTGVIVTAEEGTDMPVPLAVLRYTKLEKSLSPMVHPTLPWPT
jgi:hypothetical protein